MALFDLANSVRVGNPVEEIAMFLCRSRREVGEEIAERSGELARRIEEAAAMLCRRNRTPMPCRHDGA